MQAFPVPNAPSPQKAQQILRDRYLVLKTKNFDDLPEIRQSSQFPDLFFNLTLFSHHALYFGILSNAGQFRDPNDNLNGNVWFGRSPDAGAPRYQGISSLSLEDELKLIYELFSRVDADPIASVARFYQRFVQIHPFYDANGRIGRLLVHWYLDYYKYHMQWADFSQSTKWLKKLNACHNRYGQSNYEEYLGYFVNYMRCYVSAKVDYELQEPND